MENTKPKPKKENVLIKSLAEDREAFENILSLCKETKNGKFEVTTKTQETTVELKVFILATAKRFGLCYTHTLDKHVRRAFIAFFTSGSRLYVHLETIKKNPFRKEITLYERQKTRKARLGD